MHQVNDPTYLVCRSTLLLIATDWANANIEYVLIARSFDYRLLRDLH